jgi:hypothetical protein
MDAIATTAGATTKRSSSAEFLYDTANKKQTTTSNVQTHQSTSATHQMPTQQNLVRSLYKHEVSLLNNYTPYV